MIRKVMKILLLVALSVSAMAQNIEDIKKCVGFVFGDVHVKNSDGSLLKDEHGNLVVLEMPLGTAFLVGIPDKRGGDDYGFGYLVTAKHVLRDVDDSYLRTIKVRFNLIHPDHNSSLGFAEIPVSNQAGQLLWFDDAEHPENDVALVPFLPNKEKADYKVISTTMFTDAELLKVRNVSEGDSVYLVGLMPQYYGEKKNYPVVRRGSLALLTDELIQTGPNTKQSAYLAEMASWPGNSGAPVFLNLAGFRNGSIHVWVIDLFWR